jgi:hypothetical protein
MTRTLFTQTALTTVLLLVFGSSGVSAATAIQSQDSSPTAALKLKAGKKWQTDVHLRKAMSTVRDAVFAELDGLFLGTMNMARYEALAAKVDAQTAYIIMNCDLPPEADAELHLVLALMMQGSVAMKGQDPNIARRTGAEKVIAALDAYSRYFDHPGWKAIAV